MRRTYLASFEFIEVVGVLETALSGVSVLAVNINEDVGVAPGSQYVTREDAHFVGVDCETIEGINYRTMLSLAWFCL